MSQSLRGERGKKKVSRVVDHRTDYFKAGKEGKNRGKKDGRGGTIASEHDQIGRDEFKGTSTPVSTPGRRVKLRGGRVCRTVRLTRVLNEGRVYFSPEKKRGPGDNHAALEIMMLGHFHVLKKSQKKGKGRGKQERGHSPQPKKEERIGQEL